jgi:hypothetical protein
MKHCLLVMRVWQQNLSIIEIWISILFASVNMNIEHSLHKLVIDVCKYPSTVSFVYYIVWFNWITDKCLYLGQCTLFQLTWILNIYFKKSVIDVCKYPSTVWFVYFILWFNWITRKRSCLGRCTLSHVICRISVWFHGAKYIPRT